MTGQTTGRQDETGMAARQDGTPDLPEENGGLTPLEANENGKQEDTANVDLDEAVGQGEMPYRHGPHRPLPEEDMSARIDRLLRALAEAENARKRAERTAAEARRYAIGDFARDLLTVADNLQRALVVAKAEGTRGDRSLREGVESTDRLLQSIIERYGVRKMVSLGARFDPKLHEAVMVIEDETREPGVIVDVAEEGYMLHDRLLRPARVFVNNPNMKPASHLHGQEPG
jgi:molecular chaperone GrpE